MAGNSRTRSTPSIVQRPQAAAQRAQEFEAIGATASRYLEQSKSPNTRGAYRADREDFAAWCAKYRRPTHPASPDTVAFYLADRSQDLKTSTLQRCLATIAEAH